MAAGNGEGDPKAAARGRDIRLIFGHLKRSDFQGHIAYGAPVTHYHAENLRDFQGRVRVP
jgi:hypothetical protein